MFVLFFAYFLSCWQCRKRKQLCVHPFPTKTFLYLTLQHFLPNNLNIASRTQWQRKKITNTKPPTSISVSWTEKIKTVTWMYFRIPNHYLSFGMLGGICCLRGENSLRSVDVGIYNYGKCHITKSIGCSLTTTTQIAIVRCVVVVIVEQSSLSTVICF